MRLTLLLILTLPVTACEPAGRLATEDAPETICAGWSRSQGEPGDADVISDTLARWIDSHDRYGASQNCWDL